MNLETLKILKDKFLTSIRDEQTRLVIIGAFLVATLIILYKSKIVTSFDYEIYLTLQFIAVFFLSISIVLHDGILLKKKLILIFLAVIFIVFAEYNMLALEAAKKIL